MPPSDETTSARDEPSSLRKTRDDLDRMRALLDRPLTPEELAANTALVSAPAAERGGGTRGLLVFSLGSERLGLDAAHAHRVVPVSSIRRVPHRTNAVFAGIANIGGELTPVARAGAALGVPVAVEPSRFIVIGPPHARWAFGVDAVEGLRRFDPSRTLPPPATVRHAADGCTEALVEIASRDGNGSSLVSILDAARLSALFARSLA